MQMPKSGYLRMFFMKNNNIVQLYTSLKQMSIYTEMHLRIHAQLMGTGKVAFNRAVWLFYCPHGTEGERAIEAMRAIKNGIRFFAWPSIIPHDISCRKYALGF